MPDFDAIVLAGGRGRRLGGVDKPGLTVRGEKTLFDEVVAAVAGAHSLVIVGPPRAVARPAIVVREDPPGTGPVAALAAAVDHLRSAVVVVLAADLPQIAPAIPVLLARLQATDDADVIALIDPDGRANYLAAAWRAAALRTALAHVGPVEGASMRALTAGARMIGVSDTGGWGRDCDTWDDLAAARAGAEGAP